MYEKDKIQNYLKNSEQKCMLDDDGIDLLEKMLVHDPTKRISAKDALLHPFLRDVPKEIKNMK